MNRNEVTLQAYIKRQDSGEIWVYRENKKKGINYKYPSMRLREHLVRNFDINKEDPLQEVSITIKVKSN